MDREDETVLAHLRAENEFLSESFAELKPLEDELFEEIKSAHRRDRYLGAGSKGRVVVLRTHARGTQLSAQLSRARERRGPHAARDRSVDDARGRTGDPGRERGGRRQRLLLGRGPRRESRRRLGLRSAPTSTATNSITSRCARWPVRQPLTTNSTTSTTASRGRWTAVTSSTRASTTPSGRSNSGATNSGSDTEHRRPDLPRGRRAVQPVGRSQSRRRRHLRAPRIVDDDRGALPRRPRSDRRVDAPRGTATRHRIRRRTLRGRHGRRVVAEGHQRRARRIFDCWRARSTAPSGAR